MGCREKKVETQEEFVAETRSFPLSLTAQSMTFAIKIWDVEGGYSGDRGAKLPDNWSR